MVKQTTEVTALKLHRKGWSSNVSTMGEERGSSSSEPAFGLDFIFWASKCTPSPRGYYLPSRCTVKKKSAASDCVQTREHAVNPRLLTSDFEIREQLTFEARAILLRSLRLLESSDLQPLRLGQLTMVMIHKKANS